MGMKLMFRLTGVPYVAELHVVSALSPATDTAAAEAGLVPDAVDLLTGGTALVKVGETLNLDWRSLVSVLKDWLECAGNRTLSGSGSGQERRNKSEDGGELHFEGGEVFEVLKLSVCGVWSV